MSSSDPLLLDTHVWIWLMEGSERLSPAVVQAIEEAGQEGQLRIHPLSVWEVGTLVRKGRLSLSGPVERWVEEALAVDGVTLTPLTASMALESAALPDSFPGDPVDRMLVATARILGATLVTADRRILERAGTLDVEVMGASGS
jgi:PIN domain nuclease of toxin-antitoxin system